MRLYDGRISFYQWDVNQKLTASDLAAGEEVHFSNALMKEALVVKAYKFDNTADIVVDVPNILLQHDIPITAYRYEKDNGSAKTCKGCIFQVIARPKPTDYVYTEVEILNYSSVEKRMTELENRLPDEIDRGIDDLMESGKIEPYVVQSVIEHTEEINNHLDSVEAIALGAEKALTYTNYRDLVETLNTLPYDYFKSGQGLNIIELNVPDLWIAYVYEDISVPHNYTTDEAFINELSQNGFVQVGHFALAQRETQKVDLTDYAKKDQVPVVNATLKSNGAYTLTISMGVE